MRLRSLTAFATAAFVLAACGTTREAGPPAPGAGPPGGIVAGYHAWWTGEAWQEYGYAPLDQLLFFSVDLAADGTIRDRHGWPDAWFRMAEHARRQGVCVVPVVTLLEADTFVRLFEDEAHVRQLRETLLGLLRDSPAACGIQLDAEVFRAVPSPVRAAFTAFVVDLRGAMDALRPGLSLSLFLPAFDDADVFDEAALARVADYVVVQGYDLHARNDEQAGPVAALDGWGRRNWRVIVARYLGLGVPRTKLVMAVPYFGYEWPTETDAPGARTRGPGQTILSVPVDTTHLRVRRKVGAAMAARHGLRRDPQSGTPYYAFRDSTGWHQGWFEDAESLRAKYAYVRQEGLAGVAVFTLGYGDPALAAVLRAAFGE
ncbi:MAG: glycosyl hydrolase family 18 protein [Rhodothermales bacterium]|nr:glycosyl hydrolase family 18 protein [Rhodothermales bacterium]